MQKIDFKKGNGLVPVIVQDYRSREVLMVAYMNEPAWEKTKKTRFQTLHCNTIMKLQPK